LLTAPADDPRREPARLWDLWRNAERRAAQGRYDEVLDVSRHLAAQGFVYANAVSDDIEWRARAAVRKAAGKYLGKHAAQLQDLIGALNALADQALDGSADLIAPVQSLKTVPWGNWAQGLGSLVKHRLLIWQDGSSDVEFPDAESARFLHGGWLEEYAWHIVKDEGISDVRLGVRGR
jgi:Card1-like, endonuclease domain